MKEFWTEVEDFDKAIEVLDSSLSLIKWRLKPSSRNRLHTDVLALCSGMRPVVMVDYGGKLPELQERLCSLLSLSQKECCIFEHLRVMIIEEMIYALHVSGLAAHIQSSMNSESPLVFVDLEHDPPKMVTELAETSLGLQFLSILKQFSLFFPVQKTENGSTSSCISAESISDDKSQVSNTVDSISSDLIDLSSCMKDTDITVPTLNGWLLGYPIIYAFGKENIADAVYNLSTKSLHLYRISVCRNSITSKRYPVEELLSFSVPYELSVEGSEERWAKAYLGHMEMKWDRSKKAWKSLKMEVCECYPQAIAL